MTASEVEVFIEKLITIAPLKEAVYLSRPLTIWVGGEMLTSYGLYCLPLKGSLYLPFNKAGRLIQLGYNERVFRYTL